jgi:hypothetical protein
MEGMTGSTLMFNQGFSITDGQGTEYCRTPVDIAVAALATQAINLRGITTASHLMIQTDRAVDITITTPIGPTIPPIATPATFRVNDIFIISADITAVSIYNPNNLDANIKLTAVGV